MAPPQKGAGRTMPSSLFTPVVDAAKLNPRFEVVRNAPPGHPGRAMMEEIHEGFADPDGNFLEQFQSEAFDARCFELYLFAMLSREGYAIDRTHPNPDFIVESGGVRVALEATTVNPSTSGALSEAGKDVEQLSGDELREYEKHELAMRFGSPLFSKLKKRYWELEHCIDLPLVFAIQAFHDRHALAFADNALARYLYGIEQEGSWTDAGELDIRTDPIEEHAIAGKAIPSNFFTQPETEHISAVLFTNSGSAAKFSRMGFQHGYGNETFNLTRFGKSFNPDPDAMDPTHFIYDVGQPPFVESWSQGIVVCHNPRARLPLPRDFFGGAVQAYIENGVHVSEHREWHPITSTTAVISLGELKKKLPEPYITRPAIAIGAMGKQEFQGIIGVSHDDNPIFAEHGWFADESGSFLGVLTYDQKDEDWGYVILARDPHFAFRAIDQTMSHASRIEAREAMHVRMAELLLQPQRLFVQD